MHEKQPASRLSQAMSTALFKLDLSKTFPRLSHAPIVEATIHWQARATVALDPESVRAELARRLPEYSKCESIQQIEFMATVSGKADGQVVRHTKDWQGYRLTSDDGGYVVQFKRDGIVFSRTQPYEHWEPFAAAAKHAWKVFRDIAAPVETQRLGVRYINHFATATPETLDKFLREPPTCPSNLPLNEFVYQSTFNVPEQPFGIRVIKVMQPSLPGLPQSSGLFVDCDVFTTRPLEIDGALEVTLANMRWLKNNIFFTLLADAAINALL